MVTLMRRLDTVLVVTLTDTVPPLVNPLRSAAARAAVVAAASLGSHTTPARAAASAALRMSDARLYQRPTSTDRPATISSGTSRSANMTST